LLRIEDDESAGTVSQGQVFAGLVELDRRDDILFGHPTILVAEYLN
jgi:hypothetical protein